MSHPDRRRIPARFLAAGAETPAPPSEPAPAPWRPTGRAAPRRLVAGCMTGTSLDALDCALVAIEGHGLHLRCRLVGQLSRGLGPLAAPLRRLAEQGPITAGEAARLARELSLFHLDCLRELVRDRRLDLVAAHGQTVFHAPPLSWQLLNPAVLACGLGVPVVCDLRAADLACGGQGAPLTPLADLVLFHHPRERRGVVNLGGFCNLTRLPAGLDPARVQGADICACNQLLDAVARTVLGRPYDDRGEAAAVGSVRPATFRSLCRLLEGQRSGGRSLGTGDELGAWLARQRRTGPADLARTACAAIAASVAAAGKGCDRLLLAGGGVRNRALVEELKGRCQVPVQPSDTLGVPAAYREAMGWAVLGALCQDRVPVGLPQVTGVREAPVAGLWAVP